MEARKGWCLCPAASEGDRKADRSRATVERPPATTRDVWHMLRPRRCLTQPTGGLHDEIELAIRMRVVVTPERAFRVALRVAGAVHQHGGHAEEEGFLTGRNEPCAAIFRAGYFNVGRPAFFHAQLDGARKVLVQRAVDAVVAAVAFLLSEDAGFIARQTLFVDGGASVGKAAF